ncbi:MAG TPA: polymer-forming cytoskeletal protein [Longimicrobium sp.]|jgi:cytoskeletal protein CcmA (bactofilin family)|nr:polymer-forming cytoskeletal protein [Longimicrobium sp.]
MLGGKKNGEALPRGGGGEASISIIGPGMNIVGDLSTDGTVRVEGRIEGTVRAGKSVLIGKSGEVVGDVLTQDAVIGGRVLGTVVAESRLELQSTCRIEGQIRARAQHLKMEEGSFLSGQIQMLDGSEALALPAPPRVENSTEQ